MVQNVFSFISSVLLKCQLCKIFRPNNKQIRRNTCKIKVMGLDFKKSTSTQNIKFLHYGFSEKLFGASGSASFFANLPMVSPCPTIENSTII